MSSLWHGTGTWKSLHTWRPRLHTLKWCAAQNGAHILHPTFHPLKDRLACGPVVEQIGCKLLGGSLWSQHSARDGACREAKGQQGLRMCTGPWRACAARCQERRYRRRMYASSGSETGENMHRQATQPAISSSLSQQHHLLRLKLCLRRSPIALLYDAQAVYTP